jgi:hypothetical protein
MLSVQNPSLSMLTKDTSHKLCQTCNKSLSLNDFSFYPKQQTIPNFMQRFWISAFLLAWVLLPSTQAQYWLHQGDGKTNNSQFRPLEDWPTPNRYRSSTGAPGPQYWQQKVDYKIDATLDTLQQRIYGKERITYKNNAPEPLSFLWMQLDQNVVSREHSRTYQTSRALPNQIPPQARQFIGVDEFDGGDNITRVQLVDAQGKLQNTTYWINGTVMRINLPQPLASGASMQFEVDWWHNIPNDGRGAKEQTINGWQYVNAQWYPRMSVYDDVNGWQTDQFLGRGEFYLEFGNFEVSMTVPWNQIVDATGVLQNPMETLTAEQQRRLAQAYQVTDLKNNNPVFIIRPDEVGKPSSRPKTSGNITWRFKAENVRDFAWISSRAYVWDAAGFKYRPTDTKTIGLHSLYPKESMPLWDKVSTRSIWQTMESYGRMALEYPYPKATNANGPQSVGGMEYPMMAFCAGRPGPDGKYSEAQERGLISVTIHEVGHNWFPMIIASDERKWTWQDEGVNSFVQYYSEQDYAKRYQNTPIGAQFKDGTYPSRRGPAKNIVAYMRDADQVPIMTHSDLIHKDFGNNGYAKPAAGLLMLRENILGPKAFDAAFKSYSQQWAFKHPQPYDFFRSIQAGAGEDLSWYWRGWFYSTYANDQALGSVESQAAKDLVGDENKGKFYHRIKIDNKGGILTPVTIGVTYDDGTSETIKLPVDIWRNNELTYTKGFFSNKAITKVVLDPNEVWADVEPKNNTWDATKIAHPQESPTSNPPKTGNN